MQDESRDLTLNYERVAVEPKSKWPPALMPLLLCAPGAYCWLTFASTLGLSRHVLRLIHFRVHPEWILLAWPLAVTTALISLGLYLRWRRRPWFVIVNLVVNVSGLLFTAVIIGLAMWTFAFH